MPSLVPGYEYDIFISYRHKDNKTGWVTEFVEHLKEELEATFKEDVSIYFDSNAHDGLLENHNIDKSLEGKIRSVIFIPILSQTYCDIKSFAWQHEFLAFNRFASNDQFGRDIKLKNGNVASRILPVRIHDLDPDDLKLIEGELHGVLRPIDFIYKEPGVSLPLLPNDNAEKNTNKTKYRNQINKVAHAVKDVITSMSQPASSEQSIRVTSSTVEQKPKGPSRKLLLAGLSVMTVIAAVFGISKIFGESANEMEVIDRSIAVLPFVDLSSARDQEYFSDGLSEELLNLLAKVPDLKVISRTSAFSFKGKNEDIRVIADKLDVAYLLEGSVRKSEDKIRITAQLIKASDGSHLWSENYDREMSDIFKVQDEIADAVVGQLKIKLLGTPGTKPRDSKPELYNLWLQSKYLLNDGTKKGSKKAIVVLNEALALDSTDARILSLAATTNGSLANSAEASVVEIKELRRQERILAEKAVAVDPNLPDGYYAMGLSLLDEWDFDEADRIAKKAIELDPSNSIALNLVANVDMTFGRFEHAEAMFKKSIEVDPMRATSHFLLGTTYRAQGRLKEAVEQFHRAIAFSPRPVSFVQLALTYLEMGDPEQCLIEIQKAEGKFWTEYCTLLCQAAIGKERESNAALKQFEKEYAAVASAQIADIYAVRKDVDKAFEWLEHAYETHDAGLSEIKSSPYFKPYQNDPRYKAILKRLKLPV